MAVVGFITRSGATNFFSQAEGNVGDTGGNRFIARKPDGTSLGGYNSAGAALNAFRRLHGGNRVFQIRRRDLPSRVEHYEIISDPPSPNEIFPVNLSLWLEPDFEPSITLSAPASNNLVQSIRSRSARPSPTASQATAANQGFFLQGDSEFNEATVVGTDDPVDRFYDVSGLALTPPFALFICFNHTAAVPIGAGAAAVSIDGGSVFVGNAGGGGNWGVFNGAIINGTQPISTGRPDVVVYEQSLAGASLYVNGVLEGSNAVVPGGPGVVQIATNPDPWRGKFASIFAVDFIPEPGQRQLATRYLSEAFR